MTRALIFDCDGVLSDTERDGHLVAFNQTFEHFDLPVRWTDEHYRRVLAIGGGKERLATLFADGSLKATNSPADEGERAALIAAWHRFKTERYTELVRDGRLPARPGVRRLALEAKAAGWKLAVASTSTELAVRAVLEHAVGDLAAEFTVCAGDMVAHKKPHPAVYLLALESLGVEPSQAVAVEDSANGLQAALAAGVPTVVTTSHYTVDEDFSGASLVVESLGDLPGTPATLLANPNNRDFAGQVDVPLLTNLA